MEKYINRGKSFTRRLSGTEIALGYLVALPAFMFCCVYLATALVKFVCLMIGNSVDYYLINMTVNLVNDAIMAVVCLFIFRKFFKRNLKDFKKKWPTYVFVGIVLGYILCIFGDTVGNLVLRLFTTTTTSVNQSSISSLSHQYPIFMIIMTCFLAPITEELLFRGLVFTSIRKYSRVWAYVISALLFGFIHVMDTVLAGNMSELVQMIPYCFMGLVFAYMYETTDNICTSMLTHMAQNAVAMIVLLRSAGFF